MTFCINFGKKLEFTTPSAFLGGGPRPPGPPPGFATVTAHKIYTRYSSNSLTIMVYTSVSTGMSGHRLNCQLLSARNQTQTRKIIKKVHLNLRCF